MKHKEQELPIQEKKAHIKEQFHMVQNVKQLHDLSKKEEEQLRELVHGFEKDILRYL